MSMNINSANTSRYHTALPVMTSRPMNNLLPMANSVPPQSRSIFDMGQPALAPDSDIVQQLASLLSFLTTILETMFQAGGNTPETPDAKSHKSGHARHTKSTSVSSRQKVGNSSKNAERTAGDNTQVTASSGGASYSNSNLPAINSNDWSTRDGSNGGDFATPFASKNVIKSGNSITTQVKGNEGGEATLNKKIGTGFYQFNVNPQLSSQVGDIPTVFFYSGKGSDGGDYEGGFELDAEYNMVEQGTVTFGTWIDGKKYNEVTVPAPKGDQTIGFNIQNGISQIGFVNPDGSFEPVSETKDERITPELASNLQAMSNSWRSKSSGGSDNGETSSITINGFGRSDAPGQPVEAV